MVSPRLESVPGAPQRGCVVWISGGMDAQIVHLAWSSALVLRVAGELSLLSCSQEHPRVYVGEFQAPQCDMLTMEVWASGQPCEQ